jgi:hypothetical protein
MNECGIKGKLKVSSFGYIKLGLIPIKPYLSLQFVIGIRYGLRWK